MDIALSNFFRLNSNSREKALKELDITEADLVMLRDIKMLGVRDYSLSRLGITEEVIQFQRLSTRDKILKLVPSVSNFKQFVS